jgi:hypothetical protein
MEYDYDLINRNLIFYQEILMDIEIFDMKYPDNKDGHNALVKIATKAWQRLRASHNLFNYGELDPLPPLK